MGCIPFLIMEPFRHYTNVAKLHTMQFRTEQFNGAVNGVYDHSPLMAIRFYYKWTIPGRRLNLHFDFVAAKKPQAIVVDTGMRNFQ
jgi:hypothetical protein